MLTFNRSLPMILNYALDAVMPVHRELFARFGVTEQQWRVLRVLWNSERTTAIEISKQALLPGPSLVGILDRLEKKGLVSRVRSVEDRRNVFVIATAKGRALQQEVQPLLESIQTYLKSTISGEDWEQMEKTLRTIRNNMIGVSLNEILGECQQNKVIGKRS